VAFLSGLTTLRAALNNLSTLSIVVADLFGASEMTRKLIRSFIVAVVSRGP
jgi:predicted P-loop ATPase